MTVIVDSLAQCVAGGTAFAPLRFLAARLQFSPFRRARDQKRSARLHSSFANTSLVLTISQATQVFETLVYLDYEQSLFFL